ncbi:pilus assembly PilX family protein [Thiocystis violascens]|uniref:Tfp pilus assembly protein PilX n=1 Tax=Thiocystis violascens (strain ATCC 17096 / DSM 198 / 6111) TaxID=765911 RepID=I3YAS3_THIV6|nr:PilX N-terminal domain-containing pilus assembly protein [Thiocystis violascens]AFL74091.1 Tfp pilus assembly protein PilX [Thiocystis violascens DSM 198]
MKKTGSRARQEGAALIVALILLVVITLLSLSGVHTVSLEERMTANTFDRGLAFQSAEAALKDGEAAALAQSDAIPPNSGFPGSGVYNDADSTCGSSTCNANGLCAQPDKDCTARWLDSSVTNWMNASGTGLTTLQQAVAAQYLVEFLGGNFPCDVDNPTSGAQNCYRYRVTARSHNPASSNRAMVILQTIYAAD